MEGALKLKEVSYIHAEGYPAGEMKHGPIALIDQEMPVAGQNVRYDPISVARGNQRHFMLKQIAEQAEAILNTIRTTILLHLLAHHLAARRGCDVDQPRNLAKTVTVEQPQERNCRKCGRLGA